MQTYDSPSKRFEPLFIAGILGAHASTSGYFRQRDVRFLIELFSNWLVYGLNPPTLALQNVHISRFLDSLVSEGLATKKSAAKNQSHSKQPLYRLTRAGLITLVEKLRAPSSERRKFFFFIHFFIDSYGARIRALVELDGRSIPPAIKLELETLLNVKSLVKEELTAANLALKQLEERITSASDSTELARKLIKQGLKDIELYKEIEKHHPYELNSMKPLSDLLASIPEDQRLWEVTQGNTKRAELLWKREYAVLKEYIENLMPLK